MPRYLNSDDIQAFIDVIYGVRSFCYLRRIDLLLTLTRTSTTFDQTLDDLDHTLRMRCLRLICKICGDHGLLLKSLAIPFSYDQTERPLYSGRYGDIWKGTSRGLGVAVKVLKLYEFNQEQHRKVGDWYSSQSTMCID